VDRAGRLTPPRGGGADARVAQFACATCGNPEAVEAMLKRRDTETRASAPVGPVVLATLASRVDPGAERLAIESCLDAGVSLVVVNAVQAPACPRTLHLGALDPAREDYAAVRATAERAAAFGIRVEHLRVTTPRPARAIVEIAEERAAGLLVLGPKRGRVSRWRFKRVARAVTRNLSCLVWVAG
jgi:nucleotide-binding universal stress UspA family protein